MDLIAQHQLDKASQIYYCVVKSVGDNQCTVVFNNKQYTVPYYGGKPTPNKTYAIFLPHNNMNESFVIGDGKDGGTEGKIIPISEGGTGADNAADARENLAVLPLAGGTVTGQVKSTYANADGFLIEHGTANKDACFRATRSDTGVSVLMGVGSSGINHGIYSYKLGKWLIYGDSSNVYCNGTATNVTGTVAIDHGGTGATSAATARANLGAIAMPTVIVENATTTSSDADATYTVSGNGVVIVFAGMLSDDTSDYGTFHSKIYYDGSIIMGEGTRWGSALNYALGASTAVPIAVSNGKKIRIYLRNTKDGTKYVYRRFLCFGCTVS